MGHSPDGTLPKSGSLGYLGLSSRVAQLQRIPFEPDVTQQEANQNEHRSALPMISKLAVVPPVSIQPFVI